MNGGVCQICDTLTVIGGLWYYNFWSLFCKDFPRLQEFCLFQVVRSPQTLISSFSEQWFLVFSMYQDHLISSGEKPRICIFNKHLIEKQVAHRPCFENCYLRDRCLYKCYKILLYHQEFHLIYR